MLAKEDALRYSQVIEIPPDTSVQAMVDQMGKLTLQEIKTEYFGRATSVLKVFSESLPWLIFEKEWVRFNIGSKNIRLDIRLKRGDEVIHIATGQDDEEEDQAEKALVAWNELATIETDLNYLIGVFLGKTGIDPNKLKTEETLTLRKEKIFLKGFSEHFNQAFLASIGIRDVPRIDIVVQNDSKGKKEQITYSLTKGEKKDRVMIRLKRDGFRTISLPKLIEDRISETNVFLGKMGVTN